MKMRSTLMRVCAAACGVTACLQAPHKAGALKVGVTAAEDKDTATDQQQDQEQQDPASFAPGMLIKHIHGLHSRHVKQVKNMGSGRRPPGPPLPPSEGESAGPCALTLSRPTPTPKRKRTTAKIVAKAQRDLRDFEQFLGRMREAFVLDYADLYWGAMAVARGRTRARFPQRTTSVTAGWEELHTPLSERPGAVLGAVDAGDG